MPTEPDRDKAAAAEAAVTLVHDGMVVGLGTGSTAGYAVRALGRRIRAGLSIRGIPTSNATRDLARAEAIPLTSFEEVDGLDLTIDGADEIDPAWHIIKGGGGALLREKIVASASRQLVIVADGSKVVPTLGRHPVPVEVVPFAQALLARRIGALGAGVTLRRTTSGAPFVTDEGHHILDCQFARIPDPPALASALCAMPGVVEHGLFIGLARTVLVARGGVVESLVPLT